MGISRMKSVGRPEVHYEDNFKKWYGRRWTGKMKKHQDLLKSRSAKSVSISGLLRPARLLTAKNEEKRRSVAASKSAGVKLDELAYSPMRHLHKNGKTSSRRSSMSEESVSITGLHRPARLLRAFGGSFGKKIQSWTASQGYQIKDQTELIAHQQNLNVQNSQNKLIKFDEYFMNFFFDVGWVEVLSIAGGSWF